MLCFPGFLLRPKLTMRNVLIRLELEVGRRFDLTSGEEEYLAGLNLVRAAEQSFEGSCDRGGEAAVLGEGARPSAAAWARTWSSGGPPRLDKARWATTETTS